MRLEQAITPHLHDRGGFCHPDWEAIDCIIDHVVDPGDFQTAWELAAETWLLRLARQLGKRYRIVETPLFFLLTGRPGKQAADAAAFCDRALKAIFQTLRGVARVPGYGKGVVIFFDTLPAYDRYTLHFFSEGSHPPSGGMFLWGEGYSHVVLPVVGEVMLYKSVLVHELTHLSVSHLPLPVWVNEALAMKMESVLELRSGVSLDRERLEKHLATWNERTIQEFWSGRSWQLADEQFGLGYELAQILWRKLEQELGATREALVAFLTSARADDAGEAALREVFGVTACELAADFLGPGEWSPKPETWGSSTGEENGHASLPSIHS